MQLHCVDQQALRVPGVRGSQISRQSAHEGGNVVSSTNRPPLLPRKYSWHSFLLEAESTPGQLCAGRTMSMKNSNDSIRNRTRELPACSAVPQPTANACPCISTGSMLFWPFKLSFAAQNECGGYVSPSRVKAPVHKIQSFFQSLSWSLWTTAASYGYKCSSFLAVRSEWYRYARLQCKSNPWIPRRCLYWALTF